MKRNIDINEISDGNLYEAESLVKISCNDCSGCDHCCHNMGNSIILDPYDIHELCKNLDKTFEQLLQEGYIQLNVVDGIILPNLTMRDFSASDSHCMFLVNGRCSIHTFRPGFCRLFPLGRIYDDDSSFKYFNQIYECEHPNKTKVKVKKWVGIPSFSQYEKYIQKWHSLLMDVQNKFTICDENEIKKIDMNILSMFFITPYDNNFYEDITMRIEQFTASL